MDLISSLTSQVMNKALDGLSMRHKAIASNLANVDTPGYRRRDVSFEDRLQSAIQKEQGNSAQTLRQASNARSLPLVANRPGHIALDLSNQSFEALQPQPEVIEAEGHQYRNDGNTVDVENEMVQLAKNTQRFTAITNLESRNFKSIRSVITGGGG